MHADSCATGLPHLALLVRSRRHIVATNSSRRQCWRPGQFSTGYRCFAVPSATATTIRSAAAADTHCAAASQFSSLASFPSTTSPRKSELPTRSESRSDAVAATTTAATMESDASTDSTPGRISRARPERERENERSVSDGIKDTNSLDRGRRSVRRSEPAVNIPFQSHPAVLPSFLVEASRQCSAKPLRHSFRFFPVRLQCRDDPTAASTSTAHAPNGRIQQTFSRARRANRSGRKEAEQNRVRAAVEG